MQPDLSEYVGKVIEGDCLDVMRSLPDGCLDAVVTDPPYGCDADGAKWDDSLTGFANLMAEFMPQALRVATGLVLAFGASPMKFQRVYHTLDPDRMLVWAPTFTLAQTSANGMYYRWHPVWCWRLPKTQDGTGTDVLRYPCDGRNWWNHPGTKPLDLMRSLVKMVRHSGTVLDPFAGSGTTAVACIAEDRQFICIERDAEYCAIAEKRIAQARRAYQPALAL